MDLGTLNRVNSTAVGYWIGILIWAGALIVLWILRGPDHPAVALIAIVLTFVLTPGVAVPAVQRLPPSWCRVPAGERVLHRMLPGIVVHLYPVLLQRAILLRLQPLLESVAVRGV
jgi:hypothetical protein